MKRVKEFLIKIYFNHYKDPVIYRVGATVSRKFMMLSSFDDSIKFREFRDGKAFNVNINLNQVEYFEVVRADDVKKYKTKSKEEKSKKREEVPSFGESVSGLLRGATEDTDFSKDGLAVEEKEPDDLDRFKDEEDERILL